MAEDEPILKQFVDKQKSQNILSETLKNIDVERKVMLDAREKAIIKSEDHQKKPMTEKAKISKKPSQIRGIISGYLGTRKKRPIKDQIKVLRLQNMLEKKRLQNQIEKFKLSRQVELLRKKGILKQIITQPILRVPHQIYPAYSTPEIQDDIDSAFNADIQHSDVSLWGNENWFSSESYYDEKYFDKELDLSPWEHLNVTPRKGISPLLW